MLNKLEFMSEATKHGDTQRTLAKKLKMAAITLCYKLNGKSQFTIAEVQKIIDLYNLTEADVGRIFFSKEVS